MGREATQRLAQFEMHVTGDNRYSSNTRAAFRRDFLQTKVRPVVCVLERGSNVLVRVIDYLEQEGYNVGILSTSPDLLERLKQFPPALILVEATAERESAVDLCRAIRKASVLNWTPVVLLSEDASLERRVRGLESGADDYIADSSSGREILARVRALMRRFTRDELSSGMSQAANRFRQYYWSLANPTVRVGDIEIDPGAMTVAVRGDVIETTNLEFRMLYYLLLNQGRVFTRDQLLNAVWGSEFVEPRSVDACIRRLRRKIEPHPVRPTYLKTVRGAGYCLRAASA